MTEPGFVPLSLRGVPPPGRAAAAAAGVSAGSAPGNSPRRQGWTSQTSRPATVAASGAVKPSPTGGSMVRRDSTPEGL